MGRFEGILPRLGAGVGHALLNALVVLIAGKHFSWERFGRRDILGSGDVLLLVAFVMSVATIVFWMVPVRRRLAGATLVTACPIVATAIGTIVLGTQAAGQQAVAAAERHTGPPACPLLPRRRGQRPRLLAAVVRSKATLAFAAERQYRSADSMGTDDRPQPQRVPPDEWEDADFKRFRNLELSPEEFAARYGHEFAMFNFHELNYKRPGMNEWVRELAEFFFAPDLPKRLRRAREKYLTAEEIQQAEEYERDPF